MRYDVMRYMLRCDMMRCVVPLTHAAHLAMHIALLYVDSTHTTHHDGGTTDGHT